MRDQRFTAMANALIVPVRVKDETVPMVKPDSRRASVHYQQAEDDLEFQEDYEEPEDGALGASPGARSEMRTTIAQGAQGTRFLVRVGAAKIPTSKAPISVVFHSFRLIFRRMIISRSDLERVRLSLERARAEQPR